MCSEIKAVTSFYFSRSALLIAVDTDNTAMVELLLRLSQMPDFEQMDCNHRTPLQNALFEKSNFLLAEQLVHRGASVNALMNDERK